MRTWRKATMSGETPRTSLLPPTARCYDHPLCYDCGTRLYPSCFLQWGSQGFGTTCKYGCRFGSLRSMRTLSRRATHWSAPVSSSCCKASVDGGRDDVVETVQTNQTEATNATSWRPFSASVRKVENGIVRTSEENQLFVDELGLRGLLDIKSKQNFFGGRRRLRRELHLRGEAVLRAPSCCRCSPGAQLISSSERTADTRRGSKERTQDVRHHGRAGTACPRLGDLGPKSTLPSSTPTSPSGGYRRRQGHHLRHAAGNQSHYSRASACAAYTLGLPRQATESLPPLRHSSTFVRMVQK